MAEAIQCPSCTARYRLRPERVKPVIRRAKCYACGDIFPVADIVQRLLAPPAPAEAEPPIEALEAEQLRAEREASEAPTPSLTLGDLDLADEEILDKTLIEAPASLPEVKAEAPAALPEAETGIEAAASQPATSAEPQPAFPPEITDTTLSGYTSARDAIEKLFGSAAAPAKGQRPGQESGSMDMEATLNALENTLSTPEASATGTLGDSPTASGLTEEDLSGPSTSTMRLSQDDLEAILASTPVSAPAPAAEPTVALRASDLMAATAVAQAAPRTFPSLPESPDTGVELLRLKIGEDIYAGLTMPQLIAWVEEGRILENHLVARQQSENWLEAHKVPGLRPVFERLRRERSGGAPSLNTGIGDGAPKKGLFGGLFGKG
ncbi:hypothetical protein GETHLI_13270 [Geothrix limicola]|uniref:Zinc finger/thioredoxin putative domain-containing protein n=1 Tax=Geothrix limicola TaxID=2927978 RepID=A0ABQ5QEG3_9BACT|nr:zinc-ribbon domain-containing protein [Geothrix limicola]GLH72825.1 hypothetical protein GETHLI_13270 [Geothrix limicola]